MKQEFSAGAVICKRILDTWNVLLIRDMKGILTFPKGIMEKGEDVKTTAIREAQEETGITNLIYQTILPDVSYFYTRDGQSMRKVVHYVLFISEHDDSLHPQTEEGITDVIWMQMDKAVACIGYEKSNAPVLEAARSYIQQMTEKTSL